MEKFWKIFMQNVEISDKIVVDLQIFWNLQMQIFRSHKCRQHFQIYWLKFCRILTYSVVDLKFLEKNCRCRKLMKFLCRNVEKCEKSCRIYNWSGPPSPLPLLHLGNNDLKQFLSLLILRFLRSMGLKSPCQLKSIISKSAHL